MIDQNVFSAAILAPWLQSATLVKGANDYAVEGAFSRLHETDELSNAPFANVNYALDILTSTISSLGIDAGDKAIIDGITYAITEPPFDEYGVTRFMLRKLS